jgi:hypothetical protein
MFPSPEMSTILSENKNSPKEEKNKKISNIVRWNFFRIERTGSFNSDLTPIRQGDFQIVPMPGTVKNNT